jgi:hypothetical protein
MPNQYITPVWNSEVCHTLILRTGSVSAGTVTVKYMNHRLSTGDVMSLETNAEYSAWSGEHPITVVDQNTFTFSITGTLPFPSQKPGQGIALTARFKKYSQLMTFPAKARITIPAGTTVIVEHYDSGWKTLKTLHSTDSPSDIVFSNQFKEVRLQVSAGPGQGEAIAIHESAPPLSDPTTTYPVPTTIPTIGAPGTYGVVTVNEFGQVIAGEAPQGEQNIFSGSAQVTSTSTTIIDSISTVTYRSAKYQVQITDGVNVETVEVMLMHDNSDVFVSEHGNVFNSPNSLGNFNALMSGSTISLTYTAYTATNKTIRFIRTAIDS